MKKLILLILVVSIFSCKKDPLPPPEGTEEDLSLYPGNQDDGWGEGLKNNETWGCSVQSLFHTDDPTRIGVFFNTYNKDGFLREDIGLNDIPIKVGTFPIKFGYGDIGNDFIGSIYSMSGGDGHVLVGYYDLIESKLENQVEVSEIDTTLKRIKGKFTAVFSLSRPNESLPDTVQFKDIDFECDIVE